MSISVEMVVNSVEVAAATVVNEVEVSYVGIQGQQGIPGEPGTPGAGVTDDSLNVGRYLIRWNSELDTLDFFYQEET